MLGDENDGQEWMISIDVSNDAKNRQEILGFDYDCVDITGQPQELVLISRQDTSAITGNCLYVRPDTRGGEHCDHQPPGRG